MPDRVRASYDRVAARYAREMLDELRAKPWDRAVLTCFAESVRAGAAAQVADLGCGPGHVAGFLADLGLRPVGLDLSPGMVTAARAHRPDLYWAAGSLLALPLADASLAGAVACYSIIHLTPAELPVAFAELARVLAPGGLLLLAFHTTPADGAGTPRADGSTVVHTDEWWDQPVSLDFRFWPAELVREGLRGAGFRCEATLERDPYPGVEYGSRRAYVLARKPGP